MKSGEGGQLIDLRERKSASDSEWRLRLANRLRGLADGLIDEDSTELPIGVSVAILCEQGQIRTWTLADSGAGLLHLLGLLSKVRSEVEQAVDQHFTFEDPE